MKAFVKSNERTFGANTWIPVHRAMARRRPPP